jgi:hypothetical protein
MMGHNDHCYYEHENKKITAKICEKCPQNSGCYDRIKNADEREESDPKFRWTMEHERLKADTKNNRVLRRKMKSSVQDKAGNEYFCMSNKEDFETMSDTRTVDVYVKGSLEHKKFIKRFLTFNEEL